MLPVRIKSSRTIRGVNKARKKAPSTPIPQNRRNKSGLFWAAHLLSLTNNSTAGSDASGSVISDSDRPLSDGTTRSPLISPQHTRTSIFVTSCSWQCRSSSASRRLCTRTLVPDAKVSVIVRPSPVLEVLVPDASIPRLLCASILDHCSSRISSNSFSAAMLRSHGPGKVASVLRMITATVGLCFCGVPTGYRMSAHAGWSTISLRHTLSAEAAFRHLPILLSTGAAGDENRLFQVLCHSESYLSSLT